ncbi:hypothetical protein MYX82_13175 [Acidobacteria bacterium AH-259-D05]|nr:hypothetical protein [Acidobacteria bacterium AH-259-D05]
MKKIKIVGTGISKREVVTYEEPLTHEDIEEMMHRPSPFLNPEEFTFEKQYGKDIETFARQVLQHASAKVTDIRVRHNLYELSYLPIGDNEEPDTLEAYAVRFLRKLLAVRGLIEKDSGDEDKGENGRSSTARLAFELGCLVGEAEMKFEWEQPALSGRKRADDLAQARDSHNDTRRKIAAKKHAKWREEALAVWKTHPTWGALKVAEIIADSSESPETIRKIIITVKPTTK